MKHALTPEQPSHGTVDPSVPPPRRRPPGAPQHPAPSPPWLLLPTPRDCRPVRAPHGRGPCSRPACRWHRPVCHLLSSVPFVCTCVFCELHTVSLESEFLHFSVTEQRRCEPSPSLGHTRVVSVRSHLGVHEPPTACSTRSLCSRATAGVAAGAPGAAARDPGLAAPAAPAADTEPARRLQAASPECRRGRTPRACPLALRGSTRRSPRRSPAHFPFRFVRIPFCPSASLSAGIVLQTPSVCGSSPLCLTEAPSFSQT